MAQSDKMEAEPDIEPNLIKNDMFATIISSKDVFYKSQQINDPELSDDGKTQILDDLLNRSRSLFLSRYGKYIKQEHLDFFDTSEDIVDYEVQHYLNEIKFRLANHDSLVRNRRFMAIGRMIEETEYFSEVEMMRRDPVLYEQLVGQYMTEEEKRDRDREECPGNSLVNIIFQGIDHDETDRIQAEEEQDEKENRFLKTTYTEEYSSDDNEQTSLDVKMQENSDDEPTFSRAQWGNFDTENDASLQFPTSSKNFNRNKPKFNKNNHELAIMAPEKDLLREEFKSIMYANFLNGKDKDFDYDTIDENSQYDDDNLRSRDLEDKYFDSEETESFNNTKMQQDTGQQGTEEDELDLYMKALEKQIHRRDVDDMSDQLEFLKNE